jgi:Na+/H+ antiporter NhaC
MASAGSQSNHINHVSTQLPYALTVAGVSFVTYVISGLLAGAGLALVALPIGAVLMVGTLIILKKLTAKKA